MPGPAFHFQVLQQATAALAAGSADDQEKASVLQAHSAHAHLGALGPDLLRYLPPDPGLLAQIEGPGGIQALAPPDQLTASRQALMVCYAMLYRQVVLPLWPFLRQVHEFFDQLDAIAAAEDTEALAGMEDELNAIEAAGATLNDLNAAVSKLSTEVVGPAIVLARPLLQTDSPLLFIKQWRPHEFMRWVRPGQLARNLVALAEAAPVAQREPLRAYAYGFLCHVAGSVVGEPFVGNVVGGPYRTHWWRHRYAGNFIDTWVHGFYASAASMSGDQPTPPYADWANLCEAKLHERIAFAAPAPAGLDVADAVASGPLDLGALPGDVADLLAAAAAETYDFAADIVPPELTDPDAYRRAYAGAYSVLWLMTGGEGPLCARPPAGPPPDCTEEPGWVGSGGTPPTPSKETGGNTGSSVALAILAILLFLTGNWPGGIAAVAGAIAAAKGGQAVDWAQLRCNLFWQQHIIFEIEQAIRDLLIVGGLGYPMTHQLGAVGPDGQTTPTTGLTPSTRPLCRALASERYPLQMDASVEGAPDLNWLQFPGSKGEEPYTNDHQGNWYPDQVVGAQGLLNGGLVTDDGTFPTRDVPFGGAVANAVELVRGDAATLTDYNLDGDRGYGWKDWRPIAGTKPKDGVVQSEPIA